MILFSLQESKFFLSSHHFFVAIAVNTQTALRQLLQILPLPPFSSLSNAATQMPVGWLVVIVPEVFSYCRSCHSLLLSLSLHGGSCSLWGCECSATLLLSTLHCCYSAGCFYCCCWLLVAINSNSPHAIASCSCHNAVATALQWCCQRHLCIVLLLLIYGNCRQFIVVAKHFIISLLQVGCFVVVTAHCAVIAVAEIATVHCCWLCIAVHAKLLLPVADCCHLRTFMISLCRCRFLPWQSTFLWTLLWGTSCSQYRCHPPLHCNFVESNPARPCLWWW